MQMPPCADIGCPTLATGLWFFALLSLGLTIAWTAVFYTPNVAETIGPAAAVADACLRFHDGPGHPDDHHLHGWLRGGKQLRTGYGLPKPIASVGRLEFGSWRHLHARGGERGREDHAFSCFDLFLNSPCFSLTSILFVLLHMFFHEIRKLFLAGSCSERGRFGNTIVQRAAGRTLESINLAQIRFVFMLFLFLFFWHRPSLRKCDVFCCGFWLMPMDKYGQTVGNICAQRRVMPRKPEEVEEIQDFRGPSQHGTAACRGHPGARLETYHFATELLASF